MALNGLTIPSFLFTFTHHPPGRQWGDPSRATSGTESEILDIKPPIASDSGKLSNSHTVYGDFLKCWHKPQLSRVSFYFVGVIHLSILHPSNLQKSKHAVLCRCQIYSANILKTNVQLAKDKSGNKAENADIHTVEYPAISSNHIIIYQSLHWLREMPTRKKHTKV